MNDTEPGAVGRVVRRAMYVRSVSDGMDEINKLFAEAEAHDAEDARREAALRQAREALTAVNARGDGRQHTETWVLIDAALVAIDALEGEQG